MAGLGEVGRELSQLPSAQDTLRKSYLRKVHEITGRNVISYYSGWLNPGRPDGLPVSIDDSDTAGFMSAFHGLDRELGLDLLLHTPGGDVAATEALIKYLRSMSPEFRVFVPQLAMSGGTMIALSANEVVMGKHSSLGPIDPQLSGIPAGEIVDEFSAAVKAVKADPSVAPIYAQVVSKYPPGFVGQCEKAITWAREIAMKSLQERMFEGASDAEDQARRIVDELGSHAVTLNHSRHYSIDQIRNLGVVVTALEEDQGLQDAVLSYHHAAMLTFGTTGAFKIVENHEDALLVGSFRETP